MFTQDELVLLLATLSIDHRNISDILDSAYHTDQEYRQKLERNNSIRLSIMTKIQGMLK